MFSKSLFGNNSNNVKSIMNPVGNKTIPFYNNELNFSIEEYSKLYHLNNTYDDLDEYTEPVNFEKYVEIMNLLTHLEIKTKNPNIKLLLKITSNGLDVIIKNFGLNVNNIQLTVKNLLLQNRIHSILSGKNEFNTIVSSENNYNLEKRFTLSPVFSYYVSIFGIPEEGQGFDLDKIQMIKTILETNSIHPYI